MFFPYMDNFCMIIQIRVQSPYYQYAYLSAKSHLTLHFMFFFVFGSLLLRFTEDEFDPEQTLTIGVDFKTKVIEIDDSFVKLGKWIVKSNEHN